jgi:hypothetical protein
MADQKYDGVVEAVHYAPDGQVDWVRTYLRRGPTWSDHIIMRRQDLINEIKAGRKMMLGRRVQYMAGTFEVSKSVKVGGADGQEYLFTSYSSNNRDHMEGVPVI